MRVTGEGNVSFELENSLRHGFMEIFFEKIEFLVFSSNSTFLPAAFLNFEGETFSIM